MSAGGEAERLRHNVRETERKTKVERENNKVSLVGINLPQSAGMSVEASY